MTGMAEPSNRRLRADAQRNRDRLLAVAARAFAEDGAAATIDAIAREAGVGVGTIYRHFPTREALIEAAYRNELVGVCDAATELLDSLAPEKALRGWMDRFVDYMTTKLGMGDALRAVIATGTNPYAESRELLDRALEQLLGAAVADDAIRDDISADDVLINLSGIAIAALETGERQQAGRLLDLLLDGLRYRG